MKVLSVANTLRDVRLDQIDDEFTQKIFDVIPTDANVDMGLKTNISGLELIDTLNATPFDYRKKVLDTTVFEGDDVGRFYAEVTRVKGEIDKQNAFDDDMQGNFVTMISMLMIIIVVTAMFIYVNTTSIRGELPESRVLPILDKIAQSFSKDDQTINQEIQDTTNNK